jgi:hypothetical protein
LNYHKLESLIGKKYRSSSVAGSLVVPCDLGSSNRRCDPKVPVGLDDIAYLFEDDFVQITERPSMSARFDHAALRFVR